MLSHSAAEYLTREEEFHNDISLLHPAFSVLIAASAILNVNKSTLPLA